MWNAGSSGSVAPHRDRVVGKHLGQPLVSQAAHAPGRGHDPLNGSSLLRAVPPRAVVPQHGELGAAGLGWSGGQVRAETLSGLGGLLLMLKGETGGKGGGGRACRAPLQWQEGSIQRGSWIGGATSARPQPQLTTVVMVSRDLKGHRPYAVSPAHTARIEAQDCSRGCAGAQRTRSSGSWATHMGPRGRLGSNPHQRA
jgi:hypothetical protein